MVRFINLRFSIRISAPSGKKQHPFITETHIIDNRKFVIGYRLFICPEKSSADVISNAASLTGYLSYRPNGGFGSSSAMQ